MVLFVAIWLHGCARVNLPHPYETDYNPHNGLTRDDINTHFNLHRGRWWNHYQRGTWLLAYGHYGAARSDFQTAINKRDRDTWDARTYGMHFINYFPHREAGIASYLEGEKEYNVSIKKQLFKQAMNQLKMSLDHSASSKAHFYLRRASARYWRISQEDYTPPIITYVNPAIDRWADPPVLYTHSRTVLLKVWVTDNSVGKSRFEAVSGIAEVRIDNRSLFVDSSRSDSTRELAVTLGPNQLEKTVKATATDLAGNSSTPKVVRIIMDTRAPVATINAQTEDTRLAGTIPVQISAADDHGLKHVQVGRAPYDRRECQGKTAWQGTFHVKKDVRKLFVSVADRAGNITTTQISLTPTAQANRTLDPFPSTIGSANTQGNARWQEYLTTASRRSTGSTQWTQARPFLMAAYRDYPVTSGAGRLTALQTGNVEIRSSRPRTRFVFQDFPEGRSTVTTSHDTYILQGRLRYAQGLKEIHILAKETIVDIPLAGIRDANSVLFSGRIPLAKHEKTDIEVKAYFKDGTFVSSRPDKMQIERVLNPIYEPNTVYKVMLRPLEEKKTPADPNGQYRDPNRAHKVVLDALRHCRINDPCNPDNSIPRFSCDSLRGWDAIEISRQLATRGRARSSAETKSRPLNEVEGKSELSFFGAITEDADTIEIALQVIDAKEGSVLPMRIDIFGKKNYELLTEGLIAGLHSTLPRVQGRIVPPKPKNGNKVPIHCSNPKAVFENMTMVFYRELSNRIEQLGEADVENVLMDRAEVRFRDNTKWRNVSAFWKSILVISK